MNPRTRELQEALLAESQRLQSFAELALTSTNHLTGLALNPDTERQYLVPESTVVKEIAMLLQHAVQNLSYRVGPAPFAVSTAGREKSKRRISPTHEAEIE